jgi:hypothetical protein
MAGDDDDELPSVDHAPLNEGGVGKIQVQLCRMLIPNNVVIILQHRWLHRV